MNTIEIAKTLNNAILYSNEYIALKESETKLLQNHEANKLLNSFFNKQKELNKVQSEEENITKINQVRTELMDLYDKVDSNNELKSLLSSLEKFIDFKQNIDLVVNQDVNFNKDILLLKNNKGCHGKCGGCK